MKLSYWNLMFCCSWIAAFRYCQVHFYADPSSYFFDADRAYKPLYSARRGSEALNFLDTLDGHNQSEPGVSVTSVEDQKHEYLQTNILKLCVGIPTVGGRDEQWFPRAIASLVDNLSKVRSSIHIIVLIAEANPEEHPSFSESWLPKLADSILVYNGTFHTAIDVRSHGNQSRLGADDLTEVPRPVKSASDFSLLAEACHSTGAPYFALVEDDAIASRDWYTKLLAGIETVERRTKEGKDWLYIRLFYSETFLGWNNEEWPIYARWIVVVYIVAIMLLGLCRRHAATPSRSWSPLPLPTYLPAVILSVWIPTTILLYFWGGRLSVQPLSPGVREMPSYGCCSQGLVFPSRHIEPLVQWWKSPLLAEFYPDQIIEAFAGESLTKWALVPSVLQHAGRKSSSTAPPGSVKQTWNFRFELQD